MYGVYACAEELIKMKSYCMGFLKKATLVYSHTQKDGLVSLRGCSSRVNLLPPQALNIQGRLKFLHGQNQQQENGGKGTTQLALFAIATPLQPPSILEIRTKNMIFRTKHKLDFTPLACDAK